MVAGAAVVLAVVDAEGDALFELPQRVRPKMMAAMINSGMSHFHHASPPFLAVSVTTAFFTVDDVEPVSILAAPPTAAAAAPAAAAATPPTAPSPDEPEVAVSVTVVAADAAASDPPPKRWPTPRRFRPPRRLRIQEMSLATMRLGSSTQSPGERWLLSQSRPPLL